MKIKSIHIHNYRTIVDKKIEVTDFNLLIGSNNSGKSNVINAIRAFYDDLPFNMDRDFPKFQDDTEESWIEMLFQFDQNDADYKNLDDKYKNKTNELRLKRFFYSSEKNKIKATQSNIYAYTEEGFEETVFLNSKKAIDARIGELIYIPAINRSEDNFKTSGPSPLRKMLQFVFKDITKNDKDNSFTKLKTAFENFNNYANDNYINTITEAINESVKEWGICLHIQIKPTQIDDIIKTLIDHHLHDENLGNDKELNIDQQGQGFQRTLIFNLIKISTEFGDSKVIKKNEFKPNYTIMLFEN